MEALSEQPLGHLNMQRTAIYHAFRQGGDLRAIYPRSLSLLSQQQ